MLRLSGMPKEPIKLPKGLTIEMIVEGCQRSMFGTENIGYCLACGEEAYSCEPDAREYECEVCGRHKVYGAQEILLMTLGGNFLQES